MATVTDPEAPVLTLVDMLPESPCAEGRQFLERYTDPWLALEEADENHALWLLQHADNAKYASIIDACVGHSCECGKNARRMIPHTPWWIERFGRRPTP